MIGRGRALSHFVDSEAGENVRRMWAEAEGSQAEAVVALADALNANLQADLRDFDRDEREAELADLAKALGDEEAVVEWYGDHRLPDLDLAAYVDLSPDEWEQQLEAWADRYRDGERYDDLTDRQIAAYHVREAFDAPSLEWVEEHVASVTPRRIIRDGFAGYFEAVEMEVHRLADVADSDGEP